jgi:hypothetical protein
MTTKRMAIGAGVVFVALLVAYVAGYWPERQRRVGTERQLADVRVEVDGLASEVRAARLLGDLLHITDAAAAMNYGVARDLSTAFFDAAREEAGRTTEPEVRSMLQAIGQQRDEITGALARGDARVVETLRQLETTYREALDYPTGFRTPAAPSPESPAVAAPAR